MVLGFQPMNPVPFILLAISLPLLLGGCGEKPVADVNPELEGVNAEELEERDGIAYLKGSDAPYTGKYFFFHYNGQKREEGNLKQGKQDGLQTEWYENGQKKEEGIWKNGKQDVLQTRWYENGQKKNEANIKYGKLDGLWSEWYENGQKKVETNYKDGKIDGLGVEWHENGQKKAEGTIKDGERNGLFALWHKNGKKKWEAQFKDNSVDADSIKYWNSKGEPVDSEEEAFK